MQDLVEMMTPPSFLENYSLSFSRVFCHGFIGQKFITANLGQAFLFQVPYLIAIFLFTFAILKKFVANLLRNVANLLSQLKTPNFLLKYMSHTLVSFTVKYYFCM